MSNNSKGFFSRWTERREQVEAEAARETEAAREAELQQQAVAAEAESLADSATEDAIQDAPQAEKVLEAKDLPDPEKIEVGGSFASFMGANVSPQAKSAALKALWKQPQYNEIDGLLEYALDYSNQPKLSAEVSAELVKKVFRNVVKDKEETEEQALLAREDDDTVVDETDASPVLDDKSEIVSATDLDSNQDQSDVLGMVDEEAITASSSAKV